MLAAPCTRFVVFRGNLRFVSSPVPAPVKVWIQMLTTLLTPGRTLEASFQTQGLFGSAQDANFPSRGTEAPASEPEAKGCLARDSACHAGRAEEGGDLGSADEDDQEPQQRPYQRPLLAIQMASDRACKASPAACGLCRQARSRWPTKRPGLSRSPSRGTERTHKEIQGKVPFAGEPDETELILEQLKRARSGSLGCASPHRLR